MSYSFRLVRERWAAREMILARWFKQPGDTFRRNDALCELLVDGKTDAVLYDDDEPLCGVYWHEVATGDEVGPMGELLQYGTTVPPDFHGVLIPRYIQSRKPVYHRRLSYPPLFISYRREDTEAYAGRLHETLARQFGPDQVFFDR